MDYQLEKTLVFVGLMGAGKSAVGALVAQKLNVDFRDSDQEISHAANLSIPEIFEKYGEPFFREKETQVLLRMLDENPCILSTGGGAYLRQENRAAIGKKAITVWLRADLDLLWDRVKHRNTRPLLQVKNPYNVLKTLHEDRSPIYSLADVVVDAQADLSLQQMCDKVLQVLQDQKHIVKVNDNA